MCTTCAAALPGAVERALRHPEFFDACAQFRDDMNSGFYRRSTIEWVVSRRGRYDLVDAHVFRQFLLDLYNGCFMIRPVRFPEGTVRGPAPDRQRAANNRLLSMLPAPFRGEFQGQGRDGDGWVEWTEPIRFRRRAADGSIERIEVPPQSLVLEAGTLHNYNGWHRLHWETGFARWAYDSPQITLIVWHDSMFERHDQVMALVERIAEGADD
jgi:hypothetical protein